jgi:hypothetical protein
MLFACNTAMQDVLAEVALAGSDITNGVRRAA